MKKETLNYIAFYGLDSKDELYYVTISNRNKFNKHFGFDLFLDDEAMDNYDVYEWVKANCKFVASCVCML